MSAVVCQGCGTVVLADGDALVAAAQDGWLTVGPYRLCSGCLPPGETCEAHPWERWPHGDCGGPGMPYVTSLGYLRELAATLVALAPLEPSFRDVLRDMPDVDWGRLTPSGWSPDGGQF